MAEAAEGPAARSAADPLIGEIIDDRYRLIERLGHGATGVVYRAEHTRLHDRPCAIKLVDPRSRSPRLYERFEREVQLISRINSPYIVQILDTGRLTDGRPFIVMELLEGHTVGHLLQQQSLNQDAPRRIMRRALRVIDGVLAGIAEAHRLGVVHRDLKPANVFLVRSADGRELPKLLDFGLAKDTGMTAGDSLTMTGGIVGTPTYMAPEQFRRDSVDARTDIYAVGCLLYCLLRGRPPFRAVDPVPNKLSQLPSLGRLAWLQIHSSPQPLDHVSPELWAIISRLLAKEPEERFASAVEVARALRYTPEAADVLPRSEWLTDPQLLSSVLKEAPSSGRSTLRWPVRDTIPDARPNRPEPVEPVEPAESAEPAEPDASEDGDSEPDDDTLVDLRPIEEADLTQPERTVPPKDPATLTVSRRPGAPRWMWIVWTLAVSAGIGLMFWALLVLGE